MAGEVSVAILAGGLSTRMGHDKSMTELAHRPLIAHVIERVKPLTLPTIIIANDSERYQEFGLPVKPDIFPGRSSLNGLYSALSHSQTEYVLCVACDMPFLNPMLLAHIVGLRAGYAAIVPFVCGCPQGLHALYHKTCLTPMLGQLERNELRISQLYRQMHFRRLDDDEVARYDPEFTSFLNINTPEALRAAEVIFHRPQGEN